MTRETAVNVLFVCMGNICRSPTAEGVFTKLLRDRGYDGQIQVDSAGTTDYHVGEAPDPRAQETALRYGIDLATQRARQVRPRDFNDFHYVLAMDEDNLSILKRMCPPDYPGRLSLFCDFAPHLGVKAVPDPYFGGTGGFENVFRLIQEVAEGLLADIERQHLGRRE